jgi:glyoxylase-like metal-dependent hydrolase (beta-lactamase superfamily II)
VSVRVDHDDDALVDARPAVTDAGLGTRGVSSLAAGRRNLRAADEADALVTGCDLPDGTGLEPASTLRDATPDPVSVPFTATASEGVGGDEVRTRGQAHGPDEWAPVGRSAGRGDGRSRPAYGRAAGTRTSLSASAPTSRMVDASIHLIDRGRIHADRAYVVDGASMATRANPDPDHAIEEFVVWNAVIDHPDGTYLWDTGSHPDAGAGYWPAPLYEAFEHVDAADHRLADDLADAGFAVDDLDGVVVSHLHLDHAGGLHEFAGTDVPVYVHEEELKFASLSARTDAGSIAYVGADFDRELNWRVVRGDRFALADDVDLLHLPGHTPGMFGARIDVDGAGTVLFTGDLVYDEANWEGASLTAGLLWDSRAWRESLTAARDVARRHDADVLFGHDLDRFESFGDGWNA